MAAVRSFRPLKESRISAIRDGLIGEYLFTDAARDTSHQARHGVVHGAEPAANRFGEPGRAMAFDGVDDFIEVAPPPHFTPQAFSVSIWAQFAERNLGGWTSCLVSQDNGNDEDQSARVFQISALHGHLVWHRMVGARDPMYRARIRFDHWYHVVGVHDHGQNRLYVDGVLQDTVQHELWTHPSQPLHIGRKGTDEPYFFFKGALDDLRLYDRALHDEDIAELFHEGGWQGAPVEMPTDGTDPISGHWGEHGVIFLDLRLGKDGEVTGRLMSGSPERMVKITRGSYDRATGHLRLVGNAREPGTGEWLPWAIEGTLDDGELTVAAQYGDFDGNVLLSREGARPLMSRRSLRSHLGGLAYRLRNPLP